MWAVLLLFSSSCTAVVGALVTVLGHRGEKVNIRCPYKSGYESNVKYFCKGECTPGFKNIIVESGSPAKNKRFSLTDDTTNRVFTVTITDLRTADEGQYWCAVKRTLHPTDVYSEILLAVKHDQKTTEVSTISPSSSVTPSFVSVSVSDHQRDTETKKGPGSTAVQHHQPNTAVVGAPVPVIGYKGQKVDIRCPYESGYESNVKYFCKGECIFGFRNIIVESGSPAKDERFSLTDDTTNRVFTITITDLRTEDKGQYWCAVRRTLPLTDVYSKILLAVKHDQKTTEVSTISPSSSVTPSHVSVSVSYHQISTDTETKKGPESTALQHHQPNTDLLFVAVGLGSVLLVLVLCSGTFLILKKKERKCETALPPQNVQQNSETDCMYEEILNNDDIITNQKPASDLSTCSDITTVYATATNQQPDSVPGHTHSTNQVTDADCDCYGNIKSTPDVSANDGLTYSVINFK